ncbi:MAG: TIGR04282 family arsenosugar biosynthesis glycosyltransferase [Flavobacteriaceae bacterium]
MQENLIIIFARNPKLGKVKTRLAKTIGDFAALETYKILMKHTANVVEKSNAEKIVFYSEYIDHNDVWAKIKCKKVKQSEGDLGEKMQTAFEYAFELGYKKIVIIGSDVYSLKTEHIDSAFTQLETHDVVIGPAHDGGYYLLGLNFIIPELFEQKKWGTSSVLKNTLADLNELNVTLLEPLNDIDTYEDLKKEPQLLKKNKYS